MRNNSYISKKLKDSMLGFALFALPNSLPMLEPFTASHKMPTVNSVETALERFLVSETDRRVEKFSGKFSGSRNNSQLRRKHSLEIARAVAEASYVYNVDPFLLLSLIEVESRFDAHAVGSQGELGLMQIKPATARWIAPRKSGLSGCNLHQIRCNIMTGASYVGHLQQRITLRTSQTKSVPERREFVLRSYNLGPAKAIRLEADRVPANDISEIGKPMPYAVKIAKRADRMRSRYLEVATLQ